MILTLISYILVIALGLSVGSFLNVVIFRLEKKESLKGRSYCPRCKHILNWQDLIPIVSFFLLGRRCKYCSQKIYWQYPLVEILTGLIFLQIFNYQFSVINQLSTINIINFFFLWYISSILIVIFVYDLKFYLIPDSILLPAIVITFTYRMFENLIYWSLIDNWPLKIDNFSHVGTYLLASIIASGFFLLIFLVSRGKWIGFGDVKLAILLGLLLGFPAVLIGLFLAFLFGAIIGLSLMIFKGIKLKNEVPFAPFLIAGTFVTIFYGNSIILWYINLFV